MKQVLITGGAGGLGNVTSEYLASHGWQVFSADIRQNDPQKEDSHIISIKTDITTEKSVDEIFQTVSTKTDGLDGIVHLAGILILGSVAEIPPDEIERILRINMMGAYRINQAFLPLVLKRKGRIIQVTSETGWQSAAPFNGAYSMSKHALEAYSDALRREMDLLGIKVIKIQPGAIRAGLTKEVDQLFSEAFSKSKYFKDNLTSAIELTHDIYSKAADPERLARLIHKALTVKDPRVVYSLNADWRRSLLEWLPVKWADGIYRRVLTNK
jgi:NAD(P)-dependent dehydrogenase (short-subunit alcohol dehydrogenase family)